MRISLNWLKDYTSVTADFQNLAHRLTMAGLEVEKTERIGTDTVFELEITPNRPDCLNHVGIAREASAIFNKAFKLPKSKAQKIPKKKTDIAITDKNDCSRYIGAVVEGVSIKESPTWMKNYLNAIGLRLVNNVVDITNFCCMEMGQPLHAFDYDKLDGKKIIVRRARDGETITTIDGVERKLESSILVIADSKKPVAIAGIMGGKDTEVTEATKNILLESAYFDPILIRRAARALGLCSDSSYRFERGVDIKGVAVGSGRAVHLIMKYAGGTITAALDLYSRKSVSGRTITMDKSDIDDLLGTPISLSRCRAILDKLGFKVSAKKNTLKISIPSFRSDIKQGVDIIEEIARIVGYDALPMSLPLIKATGIPESKNRILREQIANHLTAQGLNEVISYAMTNKKNLEKSNLPVLNIMKVENPFSAEQEIMRPSLLPSLLSVVALNFNRSQRDLKFFEMGKIYLPDGEEKEILGIISTGRRHQDWREPSKVEIDFYDIKGLVQNTLGLFGMEDISFQPSQEPFLNGQSARVILSGQKIATLGNLSSNVLAQWDIKQRNIWYAEVDLSALYRIPKPKIRFQSLPEFPAIIRDVSLAVKKEASFDQIRALAIKTIPEFLTEVKFVEQYLGEKIPSGHYAMTISLVYQSPSRTLREEEVNCLHEKFLKNVVEKFNATIR